MMAMMAAMSGGNPTVSVDGTSQSATSNGKQSFQLNPVQAAFQRHMRTVMTGLQIQKTVGQSKVLRNLTDGQVKELTEGKFSTNKEFVSFMQNPNTEIRAKQEQLLKVRNFLPPQSQEPEIFLLEKLITEQISNKVAAANSKDGMSLNLPI